MDDNRICELICIIEHYLFTDAGLDYLAENFVEVEEIIELFNARGN